MGLLDGLEEFVGRGDGLEISPALPRLAVNEEGRGTSAAELLQLLKALVTAILDELLGLLVVVDPLEGRQILAGDSGLGGELLAQLLVGVAGALLLGLMGVDDVVVGLVLTDDVSCGGCYRSCLLYTSPSPRD